MVETVENVGGVVLGEGMRLTTGEVRSVVFGLVVFLERRVKAVVETVVVLKGERVRLESGGVGAMSLVLGRNLEMVASAELGGLLAVGSVIFEDGEEFLDGIDMGGHSLLLIFIFLILI